MDRNKKACHCKDVTYGQIMDAVSSGARSYDEVQEITRFGTGCGRCKDFIKHLIDDLVKEQEK